MSPIKFCTSTTILLALLSGKAMGESPEDIPTLQDQVRIPSEIMEAAHRAKTAATVKPDIQARAAATSHPERIHFTGYRNDAPAIAAASDVFVLPSKEREGLPRAVIEAMVYGVTPVVTSVGGMPELVEDGVSGIVVEPKNAPGLSAAIERLYRDRELAASLGQAARQRIARNFHTSQTVTETGELYKSLTGRA